LPRVSAFYGIVIRMFYNENIHSGDRHFHAVYAGASASYDIESLASIAGRLPPRVNRLVTKWAQLHRGGLLLNWQRLQTRQGVIPIDPLR
jgi:hypothetical protein